MPASKIQQLAAVILFLVSLRETSALAAPCVYVTASEVGAVVVIDAKRNEVRATIEVQGYADAISAAPSGEVVYVSSDVEDPPGVFTSFATGIDTRSNEVREILALPGCTNSSIMRVSADARSIYLADRCDDSVIRVETVSGFDAGRVLNSCFTGPTDIAVANQAPTIAAVGYVCDKLDFTDTSTGRGGQYRLTDLSLNTVALSPDGATAFAATLDGQVVFVDLATGNLEAHLQPQGTNRVGFERILFEPKKRRIYVHDRESVFGIDRKSLDVVSIPVRRVVGSPIFRMALTPDGGRLYATHPESDRVSVIDTRLNEVVDVLEIAGSPRDVAIADVSGSCQVGGSTSGSGDGCSIAGGGGSTDAFLLVLPLAVLLWSRRRIAS